MADSTTVKACPNCDATQIRRHTSKPNGGHTSTNYLCSRCGHSFDHPRTRQRHGQGGPKRGLAKQLDEADPGTVGGDRR